MIFIGPAINVDPEADFVIAKGRCRNGIVSEGRRVVESRKFLVRSSSPNDDSTQLTTLPEKFKGTSLEGVCARIIREISLKPQMA